MPINANWKGDPAQLFLAGYIAGRSSTRETEKAWEEKEDQTASPDDSADELQSLILQIQAIVEGETVVLGSEEEKFNKLLETWQDYHLGRSVTDYNHVAYAQIIGMGREAIPFLLGKLAEGDGDWIYALKCITGAVAETPDMYGDAERVIKAWLDWGARHGYTA